MKGNILEEESIEEIHLLHEIGINPIEDATDIARLANVLIHQKLERFTKDT